MERFKRLLEAERAYREDEQAALIQAITSAAGGRGKLSQLRRAGLALTGLQIASHRSVGGTGRIIVELRDVFAGDAGGAPSFRAGDLVRVLFMQQPVLSVEGTIDRSAEEHVAVSLDHGTDLAVAEALECGKCMVSLLKDGSGAVSGDARSFQRLQQVLKLVAEDEDPASMSLFIREHLRLEHQLRKADMNDERAAAMFQANPDEAPMKFFDSSLNAEQQSAVIMALTHASRVSVIHGPPGTGKTQTIVEILHQLLRRPGPRLRLVVCGPSNLSVDNVAERVLALPEASRWRAVRLGHPARVLPQLEPITLDYILARSDEGRLLDDVSGEIEVLVQELFMAKGKVRGPERRQKMEELRQLRQERKSRQKGIVDALLRRADLVFCTLATGAGRKLRGLEFDYAVIDEAAQALLPEALVTALLAPKGKLLVAGDHWQLPPMVSSPEAARHGLEETLFAHLHSAPGVPRVMLCEQYRMNALIMQWSNASFYGNRLRAHETVRAHVLAVGAGAAEAVKAPLVFYDTAGFDLFEEAEEEEGSGRGVFRDQSKRNPGEAALVVRHARQLLGAGVQAEQVGIISPYAGQVGLVRTLLGRVDGLEVSTVDGFQGREKDAIIVSLVRSNAGGEIGFLAEVRRLNVAVTRARRQLVVVGDSGTCERAKELRAFIAHLHEHAHLEFPEA